MGANGELNPNFVEYPASVMGFRKTRGEHRGPQPIDWCPTGKVGIPPLSLERSPRLIYCSYTRRTAPQTPTSTGA